MLRICLNIFKVKDLSHVPCKFFKVGSCTAGSSCPFSHQALEPGRQKDVCAWFVKGNCKFGHKCALAHVLPGQSMNMDRRNKKAAQMAAQANGQKEKDIIGGGGGAGKVDKSKSVKVPGAVGGAATRTSSATGRTGLLTGSTAPTRVLPPGSRPPLPISKAVPAPAETAPAWKDADFTTFDQPRSPPGHGDETQDQLESDSVQIEGAANISDPVSSPPGGSTIPVSTPSQPVRFTGRHGSSSTVDFGPVGSPPRASPSTPVRVNGFSPATSPRHNVQNTQPLTANSAFSVPGHANSQNVFLGSTYAIEAKSRSGLSASLSANQTFNVGSMPVLSRNLALGPDVVNVDVEPFDEGEMEEFVPSSLKDLLTPEEQHRRMTRATSGATGSNGNAISIMRTANQDNRHRYSRSVPAPSMMKDLRTIWSETEDENPLLRPSEKSFMPTLPQGIGSGTPSSFKSSLAMQGILGDDGPSPSMLHPSNASAAFLPGLHQYLPRVPTTGSRSASQGARQPTIASSQGDMAGGLQALPNTRFGFTSTSISHDAFPASPPPPPHLSSGRPIPPNNASFFPSEHMLSPSAKALQAHAPGQSLPQGLAAGYSRIHMQPPPPTLPSPAAIGASFSPNSSNMNGMEWVATPVSKKTLVETPSPPVPQMHSVEVGNNEPDVGGLTTIMSRLSYSAAAARGTGGSPAMSISRRSSARGWNSHPLSSPLSGPVITNDDDALFLLDEEK